MSYQHEIPGGAAWSFPVRAARSIKLTALGPAANATMLLFGPDRLDRLNVPDTLKAQMSACIRPPMVLMSDRGLALASVVATTSNWHDALNGFSQDARAGLLIELAKHGLPPRSAGEPCAAGARRAGRDARAGDHDTEDNPRTGEGVARHGDR